jgi:hypothetical protein
VNDVSCVSEVLAQLESKQLKPAEMLVDAGFISSDTLTHAASAGTELIGPVKAPARVTQLTRNDFSFDSEGRVVSCPAGHSPIRHSVITTSAHPRPQLHVFFDAQTCRACPRREQCPIRDRARNETSLCVSEGLRRRDARLTEQTTPEFRERYSARSGIEATASELKRAHGLGRLRVRGRDKVLARVLLKTTACNVKRWTRYRAERDTAHQAA